MPSFDIVSEVDLHALSNAVDQANRVVDNRYDFKGSQAKFEREEHTVKLDAAADIQLEQMVDILRDGVVRCKLDPKAMDIGEASHSGQRCRRTVQFRHGLDSDTCKDIVRPPFRISRSGSPARSATTCRRSSPCSRKPPSRCPCNSPTCATSAGPGWLPDSLSPNTAGVPDNFI